MMLAHFPTPFVSRPVLYRATDQDVPRVVKAELRDGVATVSAGIEPVEGGVVQRGALVFEILQVGASPRPGFAELHLRSIGAGEGSEDDGDVEDDGEMPEGETEQEPPE